MKDKKAILRIAANPYGLAMLILLAILIYLWLKNNGYI